MSTTAEAIDRAVATALVRYNQDTDKNPVDVGHAFVRGLEEGTALASAFKEHPETTVDDDGRGGLAVRVDGLARGRYWGAQWNAYNAFINALRRESADTPSVADGADGLTVWGRRD